MVTALLCLLAAQAGTGPAEVPPALTEVVPALALRWRGLPLEREGRSVSALVPGLAAVAVAAASPVLRVRGAFSPGCAPLASRLFGEGEARAEVPLPAPAPSGGDFIVVLPPALAPAPGRESEPTPAAVGLALPPGCAPVAVRVFEASEDGDPDAGNLVPAELQRLLEAAPGDAALARWLEAPHPRRWQEEAALALALPRLLGGAPGSRPLALGLLGLATAELRTHELAFSLRHDLGEGPSRAVKGEGAWRLVPAGGHLELDVSGEEVVRLAHRAVVEGGAMAAWRLSAAFDGDAPTWLLAHAVADPDAPGTSNARTRALTVPPGARRLRLAAADGPVLVWAEGARMKPALSDLLQPRAEAALEEALRAGGPAAALAAAVLGRSGRAAGAPVPAALEAVLRAERAADAGVAAGWLGRAGEHLKQARTPLERAAAGLVEAMLVRVRAARAVAAGRYAEAAGQLLALASRRPLAGEDAAALLEADAFAQESLSGSPQALLVVDGLLARRPLDRALALARQRAFAGAARWQELSNDPGPREVHFLDPLPADGGAAAPEHSRFVALPRAGAIEVELPQAPLPGHLPLLAVAALRPPGAPPVVRVNVDGTPFTVPAVGPLERVDLPARPGRHRVELGSPAGGVELLVNWAGGSEPAWRWRRYLEVERQPLELHNREVGPGDILALAVRVVGRPGGAPGPVALALAGDDLRPLVIAVHPGPLAPGATGEVDPALGASAPIEALVPVASSNPTFRVSLRAAPPGVRVLVHVSARRRASVAPLAPGADGPPAKDAAPLDTVAALTGRLGPRGARASLYLARAESLAAADEAALAREDLVRALEGSLEPGARRLALALWRHLDDVGSSSYPETVDGRSSWVHSPGFGLVLAPLPADQRALARLADDGVALRRMAPAALVAAAGNPTLGDFALLAAARQAEREAAWSRAAELWHALAAAHDEAGLQARAAAALLELPPDPLRDVSAYVDLLGSTQLDPHDPVAARLLRRAAARTRLRPVHEVDDSAGTVTLAGTGGAERSAEAALLPGDPARPGELVTGDRQLNLSLDLAAPATVRLVAQARELRPAGARALASPPISLAWARDGEEVSRVTCPPADGPCRSGPIALPATRNPPIDTFDGYLAGAGMNFRLTRGRVLAEEKPALAYYRFCARSAERFNAILGLGIAEKRPALAGLLRAMMLGSTHELSDEQHMLFMQSGTMHLFAISGLNIGVIAAALQAILLLLRFPTWARFIVGAALLWLFVDITGASPSAVRAFAMAAFLQAAFVLQRPANPLAALIVSAFVVALIAPLQIFSASFLMSYGIVTALLVLGLPLSDAWLARWTLWRMLPKATWRWPHHALDYLWRTVVAALAIGIATTLVSLVTGVQFFRLLTPGALLANLILIPAAMIVTLGGFASLLCGAIGFTWGVVLCNHAAALVLLAIEWIVRLSVQLPGAFMPAHFSAEWNGPVALTLLIAALLFGYAAGWKFQRGGWWPPFAIVAIGLICGVKFG